MTTDGVGIGVEGKGIDSTAKETVPDMLRRIHSSSSTAGLVMIPFVPAEEYSEPLDGDDGNDSLDENDRVFEDDFFGVDDDSSVNVRDFSVVGIADNLHVNQNALCDISVSAKAGCVIDSLPPVSASLLHPGRGVPSPPRGHWEFEAEVLVLHHPTKFRVNYEPFVHIGSIKQSARILSIRKLCVDGQGDEVAGVNELGNGEKGICR